MPVYQGRLHDLFSEVLNHAIDLNLWPKYKEWPRLYTRKSKSSLGVCVAHRDYDGEYSCTIVLNEILNSYSDDQVRKVIVHEVTHAIHPLDHHGWRWHYTANRLGAKWGYKAERLCSDEEINKALDSVAKAVYKYEVYCPTCGAVWKYKCNCKAVQNPDRYRCSNDKTRLLSRAL